MPRVVLTVLVFALATPALADGPEACEAFAVRFLTAHGSAVASVAIDRDSVIINRFDDNVGSQRVSTEYIGWAEVAGPDGQRRERFVCLDAGDATPVYFSFVPLD
jgi:hypothetical protein